MEKVVKDKKKRIFEIIQVGYTGDFVSRAFDFYITIAILSNLFIAIAETFEQLDKYQTAFWIVELVTVIGFTIEYFLRVWTAEYLYPNDSTAKARMKYIISIAGIIDLLSFFPFYLPTIFPAGIVAFRIFRIVRILRLFRINAYSDALSVITDVLDRKKNQIVSSVFIIMVLIIASSLCMYSLEHDAQPDVFQNAFSGIWWSVSTLLTVGYGDIYPITVAGRIFSIIITFLGVGMVAIPTGILSAGFVEQYSNIKESVDYMLEKELKFIKIRIDEKNVWIDKKLKEIALPRGIIVVAIMRRGETILPHGNIVINKDDIVVIAAEDQDYGVNIRLKEFQLKDMHPWVGHAIKELDINRHTLIVMVRRGENSCVPNGNYVLQAGDVVFVFSKKYISDSTSIDI